MIICCALAGCDLIGEENWEEDQVEMGKNQPHFSELEIVYGCYRF